MIFVCDFGPFSGWGHLMRCQAIAQEAQARGVPVYFFLLGEKYEVPDSFGFDYQFFLPERFDKEMILSKPTDESEIAIIDSYHLNLDDSWISKNLKVLKISDEKTTKKEHPRIAVLNYHLNADESRMPQDLVGPKYFPIRQCFQKCEPRLRESVQNIGLQLGGQSSEAEHLEIARELNHQFGGYAVKVFTHARASFETPDLEGFVEVLEPDPSAQMSQLDLVICSASVTAYEYACLGIPSLLVEMDSNQSVVLDSFSRLGCGRALNSFDGELDRFVRNGSQSALEAFDFDGAKRILDAMMPSG